MHSISIRLQCILYEKHNYPSVEEQIRERITRDHNFHILFITEVGSRAWGTASQSSDHDIRFVYHYPKGHYLSLFDGVKDTVSVFVDIGNESYDLLGWDVFKFLRLLSKSNPSTLEWIFSPNIISTGSYFDVLRSLASDFDPYTLFRHYYSMAKSNHSKYIADKLDPSIKNYIQIIRSLFNAIYLLEFNQYPPLKISECFEELLEMNHDTWNLMLFKDEINTLIALKQDGETHVVISSPLNFWLAEVLDLLEEQTREQADNDKMRSEIDKSQLEDLLSSILETT